MKTQYANTPVVSTKASHYDGMTKGQLLSVCEELNIPAPILLTKKEIVKKIEAARKADREMDNISIKESAMAMARRREANKAKYAKYETLKCLWTDMPEITMEQKRTGLYPLALSFEMRLEGIDWESIALLALMDAAELDHELIKQQAKKEIEEVLEYLQALERRSVRRAPVTEIQAIQQEDWDTVQDLMQRYNRRKGRRNPSQEARKNERISTQRASDSADAEFLRAQQEKAEDWCIEAKELAEAKAKATDLVTPLVSNPGRW